MYASATHAGRVHDVTDLAKTMTQRCLTCSFWLLDLYIYIFFFFFFLSCWFCLCVGKGRGVGGVGGGGWRRKVVAFYFLWGSFCDILDDIFPTFLLLFFDSVLAVTCKHF